MQFKAVALSLLVAAVSAETAQELVAQIPACASKCIEDASVSIGCSTTDIGCQCSNADELTAAGTQCVATSCTSVDDLTSKFCSLPVVKAISQL